MNHSINPRSNADERSQLEDEFARQHASDTDEQLLSYVGSIASKLGRKPTKEETEQILRPLLEKLEEYYGVKPIIYTTLPVYFRYVKENFSDYPLWIRNVNFEPDLMNWKFWQYCDKGELYGYKGEEKYIDLNVYNGTIEQFLAEFS